MSIGQESLGHESVRFAGPRAITAPAAARPSWRGTETALTVIVALSILVAAPLLEMLGIAYVRPGGSALGKIHPATYLILLTFAAGIAAQGDPVAYVARSWPRQKVEFGFLGVLALVAVLSTLRHGTSGMAYLIDAFVAPVLLAILLSNAAAQTRARLFRLAMILLTVNAAVAVVEAGTHHALIGFLNFAGEEFRASAFLGHPLDNALATVPAVILGFGLLAGGRGRPLASMATVGLCGLGLLAFGGRAAAVMVAVGLAVLIGLDVVRRLRDGTLPVGRLVFYLTFALTGPAIVAVVLGTTDLGDRIVARFFFDTSAQVRVDSFRIFHYLSADQIWFGASSDHMVDLMSSLTYIGVIENFWLALIVSLGVVCFVIFLAGFLPFLAKLAWGRGPAVLSAVAAFVAVASTSNSLATKTTTLSILTVLVLGYADYARQRGVTAG